MITKQSISKTGADAEAREPERNWSRQTNAALLDSVSERTRKIVKARASNGRRLSRRQLIVRAFALADLSALAMSFVLAELIYSTRGGSVPLSHEIVLFIATAPGWLALGSAFHLYRRDQQNPGNSAVDDLPSVVAVATLGTWLFVVGAWATGLADPYLPKLVCFWVAAIVLMPTARVLTRAICRRQPYYVQNTLVVGAGLVGQTIAEKIQRHPEYGLNLVGFIDATPRVRRDDMGEATVLGGLDELTTVVRSLSIDRLIVAFSHDRAEELVQDIRRMGRGLDDLQIDVVPRLFDVLGPSASFYSLEGLGLLGIAPPRLSWSSRLAKRSCDLVMSLIALVVLSPLMALVALFVRLDSAGPALYRHQRVGAHGRKFYLLKFRTMRLEDCTGSQYGGEEAQRRFEALLEERTFREELAAGQKSAYDPRVTRFGRFLRRFSLDELPQLFNVLAGQLSLVGPRPVTEAELEHYAEWADIVFSLKPGITGYWQVNGRSAVDFDERVRLDLLYASNWSLRFDAQILGRTFRALTTGSGAY